MSYATTVYEPAEGCHIYQRPDPLMHNDPCVVCGEFPWNAPHALVEVHIPNIPDEDAVYRMDVSDSHGRDWATNGLRWRSQNDAARWARDLSLRWFAVTDMRIVRCADEEVMEVIL